MEEGWGMRDGTIEDEEGRTRRNRGRRKLTSHLPCAAYEPAQVQLQCSPSSSLPIHHRLWNSFARRPTSLFIFSGFFHDPSEEVSRRDSSSLLSRESLRLGGFDGSSDRVGHVERR